MTPSINPFLPIVALQEIEPSLSWEDYATNPMALFNDFAKFFAVQANTINDNIIRSSDVPLPADRSKIWIKESWPYAIGMVVDGVYKMDYGIIGFNPNIPFLHLPFVPALDFVRVIASSELADYGITDTNADTTTAKNRMLWHIFEPLDIQF